MTDKIETRLALMEHKLDKLSHDLYGNGKPGKLDTIEGKLDGLNEKLSKVTTIVAILAASGGGAAGALINSLLGGG
jgi:hypothetical protein